MGQSLACLQQTYAAQPSMCSGAGSREAVQAQLQHWSFTDYLQLMTEKLTSYEREQKNLNIVLFGQVSQILPYITVLTSAHSCSSCQHLPSF